MSDTIRIQIDGTPAGAPGPVAACTTLCRDGMVVDTRDETARRIAAATVELRWPGTQHAPGHDERHPYLSRCNTSAASPAGAACARATRSRGRLR